MRLIGQKRERLYSEFIADFFPKEFKTYVEAFGGTFAVASYLDADRTDNDINYIYNDINQYDCDIIANEIHHLDYKEIFKKYDSIDTVFYLDPPYYNKEFYYINSENFYHEELRNEINKLKGTVILSYENKRYIRELYKDFYIYNYGGDFEIFRNELIISNRK